MTAFAQLKSVDDPRDRLDKASRVELIKFAQQNSVAEIDPEMPAILMRELLRSKGLTNINIAPRLLGQPRGRAVVAGEQANVPVMNSTADLARQWQEQQKQKPKRVHEFNDLRAECKRLGIKISRRDNMTVLKTKMAEHGKDAAKLG